MAHFEGCADSQLISQLCESFFEFCNERSCHKINGRSIMP